MEPDVLALLTTDVARALSRERLGDRDALAIAPVLGVAPGDHWIAMDHKDILRVALLRRAREVE